MANDLQPAALRLRPALAEVLDVGRELGAVSGLVSGSGPTVALLARDERHAGQLATGLVEGGVCRDAVATSGSASGARLVARST
jgi:4-diphosphocytidyl-2-C-methyl-D-erythritol kinase